MSIVPLLNFPRAAQIKRAIAAVSGAGIAVGSVEISSSGIRIYAAGTEHDHAANDFDEWDKRGKL